MKENDKYKIFENMKMHSKDWVDTNINKIAQIFPNCISETRDKNNNLRFAVDFDFRGWEEMQKDPDVSVEQYRKYIGTRCAGLYDYLTERKKRNLRLSVSLENKVDFMEAVIKHNLVYMGREYIEIHSKWVVINRIKFRYYYQSL